ncbi:hypothetical protein VTN77DRAFT_1940 [Rasamsonia byssochlamydoides]|uniref:uncharacterized protein n=1 Tax=Rasamsonia byssochlamydoides TaxID=89139 RepID=UPI003743E0C7
MSDSASPQFTTTTSTSTSRVKLRSSCDRCSANKIKCGQEKPACQRCRSLDLQCNYSRSMRSGKPPRSRQRMATIVGNRQASSSSSGNAAVDDIKIVGPAVPVPCLDGINLETMLATNVTHTAANPYGLFYTENSPLGTSEKFTINASVEYGPNHSFSKKGNTAIHDLSTPLPLLPQNNPEEHKQQQQQQQAPYMSPCPSFSMKMSTLETGFSPLAASFEKPLSSSGVDSSHDCIGLALGTLASLYHLSTPHDTCSSGPGCKVEEIGSNPSAPTIDQVLQVNSLAVKNTTTFLTCPCAKDFCFPILMGVIYSKILTWYQAIVNIDDPDLDVVNGNGTHSPSKEAVSVVHRPFSVGAYKLDEEVGKIMTHQLVLNELREMARSVQVFLDGFCWGGSSVNPNINNSCSSRDMTRGRCGEHIYLRMGISLDARLRYTIQEVEKILPMNQS